jgi:hypothetical protein
MLHYHAGPQNANPETYIAESEHIGLFEEQLEPTYSHHSTVTTTDPSDMTQLSIELTAPNGRTWSQPTGLFINNEFVASQKGDLISTIDPAYVLADKSSNVAK